MKQILLTLKDGVIVGASMLLPGISGGTMAIILGIYDTLIRSISSLRKNLKKSLLVLIPFCIGAGLGIVLLSKWVLEAVNLFPVPMHYLFIGVIIGSIPALYQKANIRKFHPLYLLWASIGVAAMVGLAFIPEGLFAFESNEVSVGMFFLLLVAGLLVSIALILPGISVSHMLLILGIYEMIMDSISSFHIFPLIPLAIGTIIGILAVTHLLEKAMERFPAPTYLMIIGFVLASVVDLFPGIPSGINWLYCPLFFLLGVGISLFLLWMQKRKNTKKPKHYAKNKNKQ